MTPRVMRLALASFITVAGGLALTAPSAFAAADLPLKVSVTGPGTVTGPEIECGHGAEACETEVEEGTAVTLTAAPTERGTFKSWTGCSTINGAECEVTLTAATEVTAEFEEISQQTLTVANSGTGPGAGTITSTAPGGEFAAIDCGNGASTCAETYNEGAPLILFAAPDERSTFKGWGASECKSNPSETECEVEMTAARSVAAEFEPLTQEQLTVAAEGTGVGTVTGSQPGGEFTPIECGNGPTTCRATYNEGATLVLTATRATHSKFTGWEGCTNVISTNEYEPSECEVADLTAATEVKAKFAVIPQADLEIALAGSGEITSSPEGIACTSGTCTQHFDAEGPESTVTLSANPGPGNNFVGWSEPGAGSCGAEPTCQVTISAPAKLKAEFTHTLTVARTGLGSVSASSGEISECSPAGGTCPGPYDETSTVTLTATPAAHRHVEWEAGCKAEPSADECEVQSSAAEVEVAFPPNTQPLTLTTAGPGSVSANSGPLRNCSAQGGTCTGPYIEAATVTLIASPGLGQAVSWEGCAQSTEDTCEVQIGSSETAVRASFAPITHTLTVARAGTGAGLITCNGGGPCASNYPAGTALTLAATPAAGSTFAGWSGAGCSGTATCKVTLEANTNVTATFTANPAPPAEERCVVPVLAGRTPAQARSALTAAHCTLGTVTKPRRKKGAFVVKSSSPAAGVSLPDGSKVNLKLSPKPKKKGNK